MFLFLTVPATVPSMTPREVFLSSVRNSEAASVALGTELEFVKMRVMLVITDPFLKIRKADFFLKDVKNISLLDVCQ